MNDLFMNRTSLMKEKCVEWWQTFIFGWTIHIKLQWSVVTAVRSHSSIFPSDGSYHHSFRRGSGGQPPTEKHLRRSRGSRSDRPRLETLEWREGDRRRSRNGSLTLHSTRSRHEDSCSTCSSSSDSEEEGFFLGQRIPLPPQLTGGARAEGQKEDEDKSRRGSFRRRTQSLSRKDKDKNCILSWDSHEKSYHVTTLSTNKLLSQEQSLWVTFCMMCDKNRIYLTIYLPVCASVYQYFEIYILFIVGKVGLQFINVCKRNRFI